MSGQRDEAMPLAMALHQAMKTMAPADAVAAITMVLAGISDIALVASIRNLATERLSDLVADRYADHLIGGAAA